ncbi:MAG TPA: hypothetical protein VN944_09625 [Nitrospiria bacterium]|nr:hypothetical protein [Nitrospiria bacterium]
MAKRSSYFILFVISFFSFSQPLSTQAEEAPPAALTYSGEVGLTNDHYNLLGGNSYPLPSWEDLWALQFKLNVVFEVGITSAVLNYYLNPVSGGSTPDGGYLLGSTGNVSGALATGGMVRESYLKIRWAPSFSTAVGRKNLLLGNGLVLNNTVDQVSLNLNSNNFNLDLAYLKLSEPDHAQFGALGEADWNGLLFDGRFTWNSTEQAELLLYRDQRPQTGLLVNDSNVAVYGLAGNFKTGNIQWTAEYDNFYGFDGLYSVNAPRYGYNIWLTAKEAWEKLQLGMALLKVKGKGLPAGETSYNSVAGDFKGGNGILLNNPGNYYHGVDLNSGFGDLPDPGGFNRALSHNFLLFKFFSSWQFNPDLRLEAELFPYFNQTDRGVLLIGGTPVNNERIGTEGNFLLIWKYRPEMTLSWGIAWFRPGDLMEEIALRTGLYGIDSPILKSTLAMTYTF